MANYKPINSLRGIFALMIVFHHLLPEIGIDYGADFGNSIVLFFFVLSGFHISITWKDKMVASDAPKTFLIKRCSRIFPLQWLMTLLFVCFNINIVTPWAIPFHLTLTQSIIPFWKINFTINTPSWFLSSIFFCYLVTPLMLRFAKKQKNLYLIFQICLILSYTMIIVFLPENIGTRWLCYINPFARMIDYSIGITLGLLWKDEITNEWGQRTLTYTVFEIGLLALFVLTMCFPPFLRLNDYPVLRYPIIVGLIMVFTMSRGYVSKMLSNRVLSWLGNVSMSIYMVHMFVLHFTVSMQIPIGLIILMTISIVLVLSHILSYYLLPRIAKYTKLV